MKRTVSIPVMSYDVDGTLVSTGDYQTYEIEDDVSDHPLFKRTLTLLHEMLNEE